MYQLDNNVIICLKTVVKKQIGIIKIKDFLTSTNDDFFHIVEQIKVFRVLLWVEHSHICMARGSARITFI